jgi:hypothetical protein
MPDATINLYGRGGVRVCFINELNGFNCFPWIDRRLEGYIRCDYLKRNADKTAIIEDGIYRLMVSELKKIEPLITEQINKVSQESQEYRFTKSVSKVSRIINKFIAYREKGIYPEEIIRLASQPKFIEKVRETKSTPEKMEIREKPIERKQANISAIHFPPIQLAPPPEDKVQLRSWHNPDNSVIYVNREQKEFVLSQREQQHSIRYLFTVWAKESLLEEYGNDAQRVADEMVGILAQAEPLFR